jgi:hypothetical protein
VGRRDHAERWHVDQHRCSVLVVGRVMTTIMPTDEPRSRGTVIGKQVTGQPLTESENYFRCDKCGGWFDAGDFVWVEDHEGPLPHPAQDRTQ